MKSIIKLICIYILRVLMHILNLFPMKENRVIFSSYRGTQYACNPRYISEYLTAHQAGKYEIIWAFQNPNKYVFLKEQGIKLVKYNSLKRFYYEATSKFSINNIGSFSYLPRRKNQEHINTWHSGFDMTGCALTEPRNDKVMCKTLRMSSKETTMFLSPNKWFTEFALGAEFDYHGSVLNYGLPRSDDLINKNKYVFAQKMRDYLHIDSNTVVFMYAPTWRYGGVKDNPHVDLQQVSNILAKKYGNNYLVIKRSHHLAKEPVPINKHIVDLTDYPNVQEIMPIVNIFVSDYSSLIWDASLVNAYVILFTPDIEKYVRDRGMYKAIQEWGYPVAFNQNELNSRISDVDLKQGIINSNNFLEMYGNFETGEAAKHFSEWMEKK